MKTLAVALLVSLPLLAGKPKDPFHAKLPKDQQAAHAISRLTFGARPGDVEQVRKTGVKKWIDLQLHPERIPENPTLEARLRPLESLTMPSSELLANYPPPQLIVAVATGKAPLPTDPGKRALYERLAARYKSRIEKKTDKPALTPAPKAPLRDLLSREQLATLKNGSPEQRLALLQSLPEDRFEQVLASLSQQQRRALYLAAAPEMRHQILAMAAPQLAISTDLVEAKIYRAVYSNRQLEQVLDDFWFNHFNIYLDKGADQYLITAYEREAIQPNVLGHFRDLLEATAKSPAMLFYLDNWESVSPQSVPPGRRGAQAKRQKGLNENYARELLELHTLGVDGGYTQQDIIEVARCFTGWTIREPFKTAEFWYNDKVHDRGEKTVLGVTIPAGGGIEDGMRVLDIVAHHPSTARFISKKLAQRFVADNPPDSLVAAMSRTFEKSGGDLREVMKTMFAAREFWSQGAYQAKLKSPLEMTVSSLRATDADVSTGLLVAEAIGKLGEPLYRKMEPTGYSNLGAEWLNSNSLLGRMNFATQLVANQLPGIQVPAGAWKPEDFGGPAFQKR